MSVPFSSFPFDAAGVDSFAHPLFIYAYRAPTVNDIQNPGTQWQDNSVSVPIIYQTVGAGIWGASNTSGSFTSLTVNGTTTLTGTTNINTTGSAVTTIGTGGTGAVNIGNATGNTSVTGTLITSAGITATTGNLTATNGNLALNHAGNKLVIHASTDASDSVGTSAALDGASPSQLVVSTTAVTSSSKIFLSYATAGGTEGSLSVGTIVNGVSFQIKSSANGDTSTVNYLIIN